MNFIISITLNPALDLGGLVNELIPNEKNYVHHETRFPGGNGINAARIIHRLGVPVVTTGFLGGGVGSEIEILLDREGLKHDFIKIQNPTRISVTVSNLETHLQTRLSFSGPKITSENWEALKNHIKKYPTNGLAVVGGSLPPGVDGKLFQTLLDRLTSHGISCIVDVPGAILKESLNANPLLMKPNLLEFQELIGRRVSSIQDVASEAQKLLSKIPLLCISSVENGALLVTKTGVWFGRIPNVEVQTTVGAGDSMVGAMAAKLFEWRKSSSEKSFSSLGQERGGDLLQWGLAASCATLIVKGTQLGDSKDINRFYPRIEISRTQ